MKIQNLFFLLFILSCKTSNEVSNFQPAENFDQIEFLAHGIWKVIVNKNSLSDDVFFEYTTDSMFVINNFKKFAKRLDYSNFDFKQNLVSYEVRGEQVINMLKIIDQDTMLFWQKGMPDKKAKIYRLVYE